MTVDVIRADWHDVNDRKRGHGAKCTRTHMRHEGMEPKHKAGV